jgi:hypothetical protein
MPVEATIAFAQVLTQAVEVGRGCAVRVVRGDHLGHFFE